MHEPQDPIIRCLLEAALAEEAHQRILEGMVDRVQEPQVRSLIQQEHERSEIQEHAVAAALRGRGQEPAIDLATVSRITALLAGNPHGEEDHDLATVALEREFGAASLKVGMYRTLEAYALVAQLPHIARLAQVHLAHERGAIARAYALMPQIAEEVIRRGWEHEAEDTATGEGMPLPPEAPEAAHAAKPLDDGGVVRPPLTGPASLSRPDDPDSEPWNMVRESWGAGSWIDGGHRRAATTIH